MFFLRCLFIALCLSLSTEREKFSHHLEVNDDQEVDLSSQSLKKDEFKSSNLSSSSAREDPDPLHLGEASVSLGLYLQEMFNKELSSPSLQSVFASLKYITNVRNDSATARTLAKQIKTKVDKLKDVLNRNIQSITQTISEEESLDFPRCCSRSLPPHQLKHDTNFGVAIKPSLSCSATSSQVQEPSLPVGRRRSNVSSVMEENLGSTPGLLWQYLLSAEGEETVLHPAYSASATLCNNPGLTGHSPVFIETRHRERKTLVVVLDRSSSLSSHQFRLSLDTLLFLVRGLSPGDRAAVILLSATTQILTFSPASSCRQGQLANINQQVKTDISTKIAQIIQEPGPAQFAAGISSAQQILANSDHKKSDTAQIILISGRQFQETTELENILAAVKKRRSQTSPGSVSLSFVMTQNTGQRELAGQESLSKIVEAFSDGQPGLVYTLSSSSSISSTLGDWYRVSTPDTAGRILISSPRLDQVTKTVTVSLSQSLPSGAVAGVDVALSELIEDVYWVEREEDSRMFLIDVTGLTLAHPSLALTDLAEQIDILSLEPELSPSSVIMNIKTLPSGSLNTSSLALTWQRVEETPYILVVRPVSVMRYFISKFLILFQIATDIESRGVVVRAGESERRSAYSFQYHSLVRSSNTKLCRHLRQAATMQTTALYLSPAAFARPADHLGSSLSPPLRTQSYMAYLTDPTRLIANPGLRLGVRDDAQTISQISKLWRDQAYSSPMNNYIVRRRVASPRGVEISYPGGLVSSGTDPTKSSWYRTAAALPDLLTVTPSRLDSGGAGYVATISQVITGLDTLTAVISADMTQGYFTKILSDTLPRNICSSENMSCFLMDQHGYLVTHSQSDQERGGSPRPAHLHLTHLEPGLATELLNDRQQSLVSKTECRQLASGTKKRIYNFDLSHEGSIESRPAACYQYRISRVRGTNLFLGLVNKTCSAGTSFCWCSTVDNSCLDCSLMSQDECECPCECRDRDRTCQAEAGAELIPSCPPEAESVQQAVRFATMRVEQLPPCIHTECESRLTENDCQGVLGCSWCRTELPGCLAQDQCWGGVLGAPSPYSLLHRQSVSLASEAERPLFRASPIGPVAGGIMAFFILLVLSGWGYRHWSSRERRLLVNTDQDRVIMEGYEEDPAEELTGGHNNYGLHQNSITVVSPYRMNPSYRRPRPQPGTDSDHGYSTMTPYGDQDSEIMSCLESRRDKSNNRNPPISLQSVTSGVSSRTSSPVCHSRAKINSDEELDGLACPKTLDTGGGGGNKIIVAATIHMVDT